MSAHNRRTAMLWLRLLAAVLCLPVVTRATSANVGVAPDQNACERTVAEAVAEVFNNRYQVFFFDKAGGSLKLRIARSISTDPENVYGDILARVKSKIPGQCNTPDYVSIVSNLRKAFDNNVGTVSPEGDLEQFFNSNCFTYFQEGGSNTYSVKYNPKCASGITARKTAEKWQRLQKEIDEANWEYLQNRWLGAILAFSIAGIVVCIGALGVHLMQRKGKSIFRRGNSQETVQTQPDKNSSECPVEFAQVPQDSLKDNSASCGDVSSTCGPSNNSCQMFAGVDRREFDEFRLSVDDSINEIWKWQAEVDRNLVEQKNAISHLLTPLAKNEYRVPVAAPAVPAYQPIDVARRRAWEEERLEELRRLIFDGSGNQLGRCWRPLSEFGVDHRTRWHGILSNKFYLAKFPDLTSYGEEYLLAPTPYSVSGLGNTKSAVVELFGEDLFECRAEQNAEITIARLAILRGPQPNFDRMQKGLIFFSAL